MACCAVTEWNWDRSFRSSFLASLSFAEFTSKSILINAFSDFTELSQQRSGVAIHALAIDDSLKDSLRESARLCNLGLQFYPSIEALETNAGMHLNGCIVMTGGVSNRRDLALLKRLKAHFYEVPIIFVTSCGQAADAVALMQSGVFSVLTIPLQRDLLVDHLSRAARSHCFTKAAQHSQRVAAQRMRLVTPKESEVLQRIVAGQRNKDIAEALGLTIRAVEHRRFRLMEKLGASSVAELIATAVTARFYEQNHSFSRTPTLPSLVEDQRATVKGLEVWSFNGEGRKLILEACVYRHASWLDRASQSMGFERGVGLPGKVWETQQAVFMNSLEDDGFLRVHPATQAGITTGIGIPFFSNGQLKSVIVILMDCREDVSAVWESWTFQVQSERMRLNDGAFINCEKLKRLSEFVELPLGTGIAGLIAEQKLPFAASRFSEDPVAIRGTAIDAEQLVSGVGLPLTDSPHRIPDALIMFNARLTPMFRVIQVWKPSLDQQSLVLAKEFVDGKATLTSQLSQLDSSHNDSSSVGLPASSEPLGIAPESWYRKSPVVTGIDFEGVRIQTAQAIQPLAIALAIPTMVGGQVAAITVLASD